MAEAQQGKVDISEIVPEGWSDLEFNIVQNDTTVKFYIEKLTPLKALALFERIRPGIGAAMAHLRKGDMNESSYIDMVCLLPPETVALAMDRLFKTVRFTRSNIPDPVTLQGDIDSAFDGLEPIAIYEVLVRCLVVNFIGSFSALLSRMDGEETQDTLPQDTQMSIPL